MTALGELIGCGGKQGDPIFLHFDFPWDSDDHGVWD
jgi:hypothetical protein